MSKINIKGVIRNIKKTNVFDPIIEGIVNGIEAIKQKGNLKDGEVTVTFIRNKAQQPLGLTGEEKSDFIDVEISDNGIGLNEKNYNAFDEFYTENKYKEGGKGFGRFMYAKHFEDVRVESVYHKSDKEKERITFNFGKSESIIENPRRSKVDQDTQTTIFLGGLKERRMYKELKTNAKSILERMLVYFVSDRKLPKIILKEKGTNEQIILNDLYKNGEEIIEEKNGSFVLKSDDKKKTEKFQIKIFKVFSPKNQKSKLILAAHSREVLSEDISKYITEFQDEFSEVKEGKGNKGFKRNYVVKAYILGKYLDENVNPERSDFTFPQENNLFFFSREGLERKAVEIIKKHYKEDVQSRRKKKIEKVKKYLINVAPYYRAYEEYIDWDGLPMDPSEEEMDEALQKVKYSRERKTKNQVNEVLQNYSGNVADRIEEVLKNISDHQQSDLARYITSRRVYLDFFKKVLEKEDNDQYEKEGVVHDIIFPRKKDSEEVLFKNHNLWILDERFNFVEYLRSDLQSVEGNKRRPDLILYNKKITYRESNTSGNPVIIFEFKRPGDDSFTDNSAKNDPYDQIVQYVKDLKSGSIRMSKGRPITIGKNTPFYAFIIADHSQKVQQWLSNKDFEQLPNGDKWMKRHSQYKLFTEYITWDQLLNDAEERNKIFFHHLGIDNNQS